MMNVMNGGCRYKVGNPIILPCDGLYTKVLLDDVYCDTIEVLCRYILILVRYIFATLYWIMLIPSIKPHHNQMEFA
jgi:hypothetical protein